MPIHFMHKKNIQKLKKGEPVNIISSDNIVDRAVDIHINRLKKLKDLNESKLLRAENILLRNKFIEQQKRNNYKSEYDRLRSTLSKNVFKRVVDSERDNEKRNMWLNLLQSEN